MTYLSKFVSPLRLMGRNPDTVYREGIKTIVDGLIKDVGLDSLARDWLVSNTHPFFSTKENKGSTVLILNLDKYKDIIKDMSYCGCEDLGRSVLTSLTSRLRGIYIKEVMLMGLLPKEQNPLVFDNVNFFDPATIEKISVEHPQITFFTSLGYHECRFFLDEKLICVYPTRISFSPTISYVYMAGLFGVEKFNDRILTGELTVNMSGGPHLDVRCITDETPQHTVELPGFTERVRKEFDEIYKQSVSEDLVNRNRCFTNLFSYRGYVHMLVCSAKKLVVFSTMEISFINSPSIAVDNKPPSKYSDLMSLFPEKIKPGHTQISLGDHEISWYMNDSYKLRHSPTY